MCALLADTIRQGRSALGSLVVRRLLAYPCVACPPPLDATPWWAYPLASLFLLGLASLFRSRLVIRAPLWLLRHTFYRLRVHGLENLPATGPALLVCNHVSHIDSLLLL